MNKKIILMVPWMVSVAFAAEPAASTAPVSALSVYQIHPKIDYPILGIAALGAGVPLLFEKDLIEKECNCLRGDVNPFDRPVVGQHSKAAGLASHLIVAGALIAPVYIDYKDVGWNKTFAEDFVVYTQVLAVNSAMANIARFGAKRPRPEAYRIGQPVTEASEFESFYSGHTASVFAGLSAVSMTYTYRYGPSPWPWVITAGAGIAESMLRVYAGRHFYTDSLAGAAAGTLFGTVIPMLHHRQKDGTWSVLPTFEEDTAGLVFNKKF